MQDSQTAPVSGPPPKNLVLCFDGTGDWAATDFTNVMKIFERAEKSDRQLVHYEGGVGTLGSPLALTPIRRLSLQLIDLATATSLQGRVLDGYRFIVSNYESGDKIFLIGFSRGAFTARLVAALVHNFGLLERKNLHLADYLWQAISRFGSIGEFEHSANRIKGQFSQKIHCQIAFMGLFDTVSSVGIVERFKTYPSTDKNGSVDKIRHAVSRNEQRNAFPEQLIVPKENDTVEIWFPGVHRDIGGGGDSGISFHTLAWIADEASKEGLILGSLESEPQPPESISVSLFNPYVFLGLYPLKMFDYQLLNLKVANVSYSSLVDKVMKRRPTKDPGFRYFWPNLRNIRVPPDNAWLYDIGSGKATCGSQTLPLNEIPQSGRPVSAPCSPSLLDFGGVVFGTMFVLLATIPLLDLPLEVDGTEVVKHLVYCGLGLFAIYLIQQGFAQFVDVNMRNVRFINRWMPAILVSTFCLYGAYASFPNHWPLIVGPILMGTIVGAIAQSPGKPALTATRVLPLFAVPLFLLALARWFPWLVLTLIKPWVVWNMPGSWFDMILWIGALVIFLHGVAQIPQDRAKMIPIAETDIN